MSAWLVGLALVLGVMTPALAGHGNQRLELTPEAASHPQGATHTVTATLYQGNTNTTGGADNSTGPVVVDFTIRSGPNAGEDYNCTILTGTSNCSVSYVGDGGVGTDLIEGSVRGHSDPSEGRYAGPTDCPTAPSPNEPNQTSPGTEAGCAEGTAQPGATAEDQSDGVDVVEVDWTQSVAGQVCLDAEPNSDTNRSGSTHQIEARVTDGAKLADGNGTFDCSGDPRGGVAVTFELSDDDPNAYFDSVDGQPTGASGGAPDSVTCTTASDGSCSATIETVSSAAEGTNAVTAEIAGDTPDDVVMADNSETVEKTWRQPGQLNEIDASPEAETNEVGEIHEVGAQALDEFGDGIQGMQVSFQVTGGPHSDNDLDSDGNTPGGYFGQCTTDANGTCSESYTGIETGNDSITVFQDDDSDFTFDAPVAGMGGDQPSDEVAKTWVAEGQGTSTVRLDMETDPNPGNNVEENGDCDGDRTPPINENGWEDRARDNQVGRNTAHKICAERFGPNDEPHVGLVTFRIASGPGHFTDDSGQADLGDQVTTGEDAGGYNVAYLSSTMTGDTVVEASADGATDTGTKPWTAAPSTARTVNLSPGSDSGETGTEHEFTATVTDRFGNPVQGVEVTFNESGAGRFVEGGSQVTRTTDASGTASVRVTAAANEEGSQEITASLDADDTDCDLGVNQPEAGDPAGDCSDSASMTWTSDDGQPSECEQEGVICGTEGDDVIEGTEGDDVIIAFGGNDVIDGKGGNDIIRSGPGNDTAVGGPGEDTIRGGGGDDQLSGDGGRDILRGGSGNDTLLGRNRDDTLYGGSGTDILRGSFGADVMNGGTGPDHLAGGRGPDLLRGNRGHDSLFAGKGHDTIDGGRGHDRCRGGAGNDRARRCES